MLKKTLLVLLVLMFVVSSITVPAQAAYSYYGQYEYSTGILFWKHHYTAKVWRDSTWFMVFHGSPSVSSGFEYKNNTNVVLTQSRPFSISSQNKSTLSVGVDFSDYGVPVNVGGSIENTTAASWGIANTSQRTIEASAPKGYYSYNVCMNTYKIKITRYENGASAGTIEFFAPRSQPYRAIVYNRNNASYSGVSLY